MLSRSPSEVAPLQLFMKLRRDRGPQREITLAGKPQQKRMKPEALAAKDRQVFVPRVIAILETGQSSKFQFEAAVRHGLRSGFCLDGAAWGKADARAAAIVSEALRRIGAERPTWIMGQPEFTQDGHAPVDRKYCLHCSKPMKYDPESWSPNARQFCSDFCRTSYRNQKISSIKRAVGRAELAATLIAIAAKRKDNRDIARTVECEGCGRQFVRERAGQTGSRFCSRKCANTRKRAYPPRPCAQCGDAFSPAVANARYCSRLCNDRASRARKRAGGAAEFRCEELAPEMAPNN